MFKVDIKIIESTILRFFFLNNDSELLYNAQKRSNDENSKILDEKFGNALPSHYFIG